MDNFLEIKPKEYRYSRNKVTVDKLRPDFQRLAPNLPWHDFSLEGGYIFSHVDGEMVGTYKREREYATSIFD